MTGQELLQYNRDLNLQGFATDPDWIAVKVQEGVLYEQWAKMLSEVKECLESCFGDDWDLHIKILEEKTRTITKYNWINYPYQETTAVWDVVFCPILHFREFTITNTAGHTHVIRDLYVSIDITFDFVTKKFKLQNICGTRMTVTPEEFNSGYLQSHLVSSYARNYFNRFPTDTSDNFTIWKTFCLGTGEILDLLSELANNFDCDIFQLLLFHIQTMVKWESTEGTPFIEMSKVTNNTGTLKTVDFDTCEKYYEQKLKPAMQVWENKKELKIAYSETYNKFIISDDAQLEDFVKFSDNINDYNNICDVAESLACVKDTSNNFRTYFSAATRRNPNVPQHLNNKLVFRKQLVPFVFYRQDRNTENLQFFLHPQIKNYVKNRLQEELTEKVFRYSAIENCY